MHEHLEVYLNDHLAGSVAAIELMEDIAKAGDGDELSGLISRLRDDVIADRDLLVGLMERLEMREHRTRKALAWVTEKITAVKLRLGDPSTGALGLLEALDALASGIEGKRALWQALGAAAKRVPDLAGLDYAALEASAVEQRLRLDPPRAAAAIRAFSE